MIDSQRLWQLIFLVGGLIGVGAIIGGVGGYLLGKGDAPPPEDISAAPEVRQVDGSVIAERRPDPEPLPAPHAIPKKTTEVRRVAVTVQPKKEDCPPVRLDLSLIRDGAGQRVIASSPDGTVTSALDIPIVPALVLPPARPWAAGVSWEPRHELGGVWVDRDISRIRVGAEIGEDAGGALQARVKLGWRF